MKLILNKPDTFGALASVLCMLHCIATPLLFIIPVSSLDDHEIAPTWWRSIDFLLLILSFFAVYRSTQTTNIEFIKLMFWASWGLLFIILMNEKLAWISLPEYLIYIPTGLLIVLHLYNLNYCQCKNDQCCIDHE